MSTSIPQFPSEKSLNLLSRLLFERSATGAPKTTLKAELLRLTRPEFDDLLTLAQLNHVVIRALEPYEGIAAEARDSERSAWVREALEAERRRIDTAMLFLDEICSEFEDHGYGVTVIKSLDHWPDMGSDLDLYTDASPEQVCGLMQKSFEATIAARSWGDRLACKWNFEIPGLPESVEVHVGRLGQTGEQVTIASSLLMRTRQIQAGDHKFRVTAVSDRLLISTLQRMYRHFYFRLCDIVDSAHLVETGAIDYDDLRMVATRADIWKGTATYLAIVSDYVKSYRGTGLELPQMVRDAAQFGGSEVYYARGFIRVPILPQSARLYTAQLAGVLGKGKLHNGARLSLLPWLATAAVVGQKLTGSDKGIW
ncbi:MAG: hypothetical protein ACLGSH_08850 [Acidobacteriota bacterium]